MTPDALSYEGKLALVELQNGDDAPSYVAGTQNFYAITRYNWSSYYAMAVIDLGAAVARERGGSDLQRAASRARVRARIPRLRVSKEGLLGFVLPQDLTGCHVRDTLGQSRAGGTLTNAVAAFVRGEEINNVAREHATTRSRSRRAAFGPGRF